MVKLGGVLRLLSIAFCPLPFALNFLKMGINELWKVLEPAAEPRSLKDYLLVQSLILGEQNGTPIKPLVMGIDASIWMNECQAVFHHRRHAQMGQNPELRTLFYRLAGLLECTVTPVFVFDGPYRPARKRGKAVVRRENWLAKRFREMIDAFGFYSHMAPGEAEAELASLNALQYFQAIMTEDSDAFIFGAKTVIRRCGQVNKSDEVKIYSSEHCEALENIRLTSGGFLLIALLRGGDYDNGLRGCGIKTAHNLGRYSGLGESLHLAACKITVQELPDFLLDWRDALRTELSSNVHGYLEARQPAVAISVTDSFPDINVLNHYVHPTVTLSQPAAQIDASEWVPRLPDLECLFRLCERSFSWEGREEILKKFKSLVWNGVCVRQILQFNQPTDSSRSSLLSKQHFSHVRKSKSVNQRTPAYLVDVDIRGQLERIIRPDPHSHLSTSGAEGLIDTFSNFTATLPTALVNSTLADVVADSLAHKKSIQSRVSHLSQDRKDVTKKEIMPRRPSSNRDVVSLGFIDLTQDEVLPFRRSGNKEVVSLGFIDLTED
ncbi:hypothetical protein GALMADRAFT_247269 [Galerina marginata CBS 339.88]|uniref:XPG-I domain-containing protein n=1 Tax=Galerina marginata (strain CBS 339.88) TaxID=685588 RepID=A0A067T195_GALM3|nr:hypothetical protein GALMADRAFT_247269 [Galerina marginata CBS 339.88]